MADVTEPGSRARLWRGSHREGLAGTRSFPHSGMANLDRKPQTILPSSPSVGRRLRAADGAGQSEERWTENRFRTGGNADLNPAGHLAHSAGVDR